MMRVDPTSDTSHCRTAIVLLVRMLPDASPKPRAAYASFSRRKPMRRALILAVGLVALGVGTSWAALITNSDLLPPDGVYRTPGQVHAEYQAGANTFILQDILHFG